jgi:hypothetical protein
MCNDYAVPTVYQRLVAACPYYPEANGMIKPGAVAPYDAYLFSCCTERNTCNSTVPDDCSKAIIERFTASWATDGCGSYKICPSGWNWDNTVKRWSQPSPSE